MIPGCGLLEGILLVAFLCCAGYSTMCGHACISLGRYAIDYKFVKPVSPETLVNIQCPCGLVPVYVQYDSETGKTSSVRFESVPSYAVAVDQSIKVGKFHTLTKPSHLLNNLWNLTHTHTHTLDGIGEVRYDLGYGGAFYALVDVNQLHMDLKLTAVRDLEQTATTITEAIRYPTPVSAVGGP